MGSARALSISLSPAAIEPPSIDGAELDPAACIDHPSGFLALSPRNRRFTVPGVSGFIAYREQGRHRFAWGGAHGPTESARAALLDAFLDETERLRRRVVAVQLRLSQADLFRSRGFTINRFGTSYGLRIGGGAGAGPGGWSMAGTRRMKLRNKVKRARAAGLRVLEVGVELPSSAETFARIDQVSASWLRAKGKKELDFLIGEVGAPGDAHRRVFVAVDEEDTLCGFITYAPAWGERRGWLHDLTRRLPTAPVGTMELINAHAMERLAAEGAEWLHFGFTPFVVPDGTDGWQHEGPGASRALAWALGALRRWGSFLYPAMSQVDYKLKWGPEAIEPELVACRPLSLRAVIDLLLLTRSV